MRFAPLNRRKFLQISAAAGAAIASTPALLSARSPNEKLNVAIIGPGGQGRFQLEAAGQMENIVAICDIDENILADAAGKYPKAKTYVDFRKMLEEMAPAIDAVMVSTPDHTHAPASAMAMRLGKHCYCEKPLAHYVYEARVLAQLAKEKNLVTQMGTQIHASDNYRRVVELIRSGAIGPIGEVHAWCDFQYGGLSLPTDTPETPRNLHWDLWLGPAAYRPYHPCYMPGIWRNWWAFGAGVFGDFACHLMDLAFWALDLRHPQTIEAEGPPVNAELCSQDMTVAYEFAARGVLPPLKLVWHDGVQAKQSDWLPNGQIPIHSKGVLFVGKDGMLWADYETHRLLPEERFKDFVPPEPTIPNSIGHHKEFFEACKTGGPTTCNFDYSGALSEAVLLGTVAYRVGQKIEWDAENLGVPNCPEADQYLRSSYREGWTL